MMHSKAPVDANPGGYTRCEDTQKSHSEPAQPVSNFFADTPTRGTAIHNCEEQKNIKVPTKHTYL